MRWRRAIPVGLGIAALGALAYATLVEPYRFTLRRFEVPVLEPDAEPLRVLHLSDLHLLPGHERKREWVRGLAALDPDLVVVTGDMLAGAGALDAVRDTLEPLSAWPGAFVLGNSDYFAPVRKSPTRYFGDGSGAPVGEPLPSGELRAMLREMGWADLNNARTTLKAGGRVVELSGVDDPHTGHDDYTAVAGRADEGVDLRIGLLHSPEPRLVDAFAADGFDLVLAGHTHGGQVCVPGYGALVTNCGIDRARAKGLHRWSGDTWLHVSAGLGTNPYTPIRFACPPEASMVTAVASPESRDPHTRPRSRSTLG